MDKISKTGAEWHVDCGDVVEIKTRCRIPIWRTFAWANLMACHPRATYHIAGCCHLVNSLSRFQSHMPHCRVQSPGEIKSMSWSCHIAGCKNSIRHWKSFFAIFFVLMQFRLWRAAAFVLFPTHLFWYQTSWQYSDGGVECKLGR